MTWLRKTQSPQKRMYAVYRHFRGFATGGAIDPFGRPAVVSEAIIAGNSALNDTIATTTYARLTPRQSRAVLIAVALTLVGAVAITLSPAANSGIMSHCSKSGDLALYRAEANRIHAGDGYYEALAAELTARDYPTRSVFNWRTPLPVWLIGKLPLVEMGKPLLGLMALALLLMAFEAVARELGPTQNQSLARPIGCTLLLTGPLMLTIVGDLFVFPELWAGVLVALSACAYGIARPRLGFAFGLAAIFFRELALPYCLVCAAMAWQQGRRRELAAWTVGLLAWLAFFGLHAWQVHQTMPGRRTGPGTRLDPIRRGPASSSQPRRSTPICSCPNG